MRYTILYRAFVLFLGVFMLGQVALCQDFGYRKSKVIQPLSGDIKTICLFVDTEEECWSSNEKRHYYGQLEKSQAWINAQAERYGAEVNWENDHFGFNKDILYLSKYHRFSPRLMLTGTAEAFGIRTMDELLKDYDVNVNKDKVKLIYFVKSKERSLAVNFWSSKKLDVAIINCKTTYGMMTDYHTIAHEILHQFGAWDLYYGMSQSKEKAEAINEQFPYSIMINTHVHKDRLAVDELTASLVGWLPQDQVLLEKFKPVWKNPYSTDRDEQFLSPEGKK